VVDAIRQALPPRDNPPGIVVRIEKYPVPILWLDSFIFINAERIATGRSVPEVDCERTAQLLGVVSKKCGEQRLICIEADQSEELKQGGPDAVEGRTALVRASRMVRFRHRREVERIQFFHLARAFLDGDPEVVLPYRDVFKNDPLAELASDRRLLLFAHTDLSEDEIHRWRKDRERMREGLEELRQANRLAGVTFAQQCDREYNYLAPVTKAIIDRAVEKIMSGDQEGYLGLIESPAHVLRAMWLKHGWNLDDFWRFTDSAHFRVIPTMDISARLNADLLTGTREIEGGDAMDVDQVAAVLPYCDILLVDRRMRNRLKRLRLDRKWSTCVYAMADFDDLITKLERL